MCAARLQSLPHRLSTPPLPPHGCETCATACHPVLAPSTPFNLGAQQALLTLQLQASKPPPLATTLHPISHVWSLKLEPMWLDLFLLPCRSLAPPSRQILLALTDAIARGKTTALGTQFLEENYAPVLDEMEHLQVISKGGRAKHVTQLGG